MSERTGHGLEPGMTRGRHGYPIGPLKAAVFGVLGAGLPAGLSAFSQLTGRAEDEHSNEACALAQAQCLTPCLTPRPCGCRVGHPYEVTCAYLWINPPSRSWHRRHSPDSQLVDRILNRALFTSVTTWVSTTRTLWSSTALAVGPM